MSSLVPCFTVSEYSGGPVETGETAGKAERPRYFPRSPRPLSLRSFKLQYSTSFSHVVINCMNILTRRMLYAKRSCSGLETGCSHVSLEHQMVVTVCTAHVMCPKSFLSLLDLFLLKLWIMLHFKTLPLKHCLIFASREQFFLNRLNY